MIEVNTVGLRRFTNGNDAEGLGMGTRLSDGTIMFFVNIYNTEDEKKFTDFGFMVVYNFKRSGYLATMFYGKVVADLYIALNGII